MPQRFMSDFLQSASVITLPLLDRPASGTRHRDLTAWSHDRPLALVLPCHRRELGSPALARIRQSLAEIPWLRRLVIGLDAASESEFTAACRQFSGLPCEVEILWHDGPRAEAANSPAAGFPTGKGRNLWLCCRAALADPAVFAVAAHDADIVGYSPDFLSRLCWPVLHPEAGIDGCKGWYSRHASQLHGRLFRLLVQPLCHAIAAAGSASPWISYLGEFRYALSGEWCLRRSALQQIPFGTGWDAEIRMLHAWHSLPQLRICQTELCQAYDHRHHDLSGLGLMASEVASAIWQGIAKDHLPELQAVLTHWHASSTRSLQHASLTAGINGLMHSPEAEAAAAQAFSAILPSALRNSSPPPLLPPPADEKTRHPS
jgi:glucosyl-3-phosphoglycerate synthase